MLAASPAGACRQADAVYSEPEALASLEFSAVVDAPMLTNKFSLTVGETVLEGIVMWTADPLRPDGALMLDCPEGDVTGAEIDACTPWRGTIYAADAAGKPGLLPAEDAEAAVSLILPDLALSLAGAGSLGADARLPFDIFTFKECRQ